MAAQLNIVTLGVSDLKKARKFYEKGLGWKASSASQGDIVFFQLGGVVLALYPRDLLAGDATVKATGSGFRGITLAQNVREKGSRRSIKNRSSGWWQDCEACSGRVLGRTQRLFR